jgi:hypothetical protein
MSLRLRVENITSRYHYCMHKSTPGADSGVNPNMIQHQGLHIVSQLTLTPEGIASSIESSPRQWKHSRSRLREPQPRPETDHVALEMESMQCQIIKSQQSRKREKTTRRHVKSNRQVHEKMYAKPLGSLPALPVVIAKVCMID